MSSLDYKIKKAAQGTAPHPAILLLHGYGSNADDLFTFADYLPEQYTIISLEAPLANPYRGKAWYSINFDADVNFLKEAVTNYDKKEYAFENKNENLLATIPPLSPKSLKLEINKSYLTDLFELVKLKIRPSFLIVG